MPNLQLLLNEVSKLNAMEQEQLLTFLEDVLVVNSYAVKIPDEVKENRFSKGKRCPHCHSDMVNRNGKYANKQRYICKSCNRTFTDFTHSPIANSKYTLSKWLQYAKCMINGYSIRKSAEVVDINVATSFFWRHKILDAIRAFMGVGYVNGIVEADETFFRESFKGNHKKK